MPKILFLFSFLLVVPTFSSTVEAVSVQHHGYLVNTMGNSRECLACHDGSMAKAVSGCLNGRCPVGGSHPVDIPYPPPGRENEYRPAPAVLDANIMLVNGRVSCISCHNLANPQPGHPSADLAKSNLCLSCHLK